MCVIDERRRAFIDNNQRHFVSRNRAVSICGFIGRNNANSDARTRRKSFGTIARLQAGRRIAHTKCEMINREITAEDHYLRRKPRKIRKIEAGEQSRKKLGKL